MRLWALLLAAAAVVPVAAFASEAEGPPVEAVGSIMVAFGEHLEAHPLAAAEDLYKFLYQAVFGPGHAVPSREAAVAYLERELEGLGPPPDGEARCEALGGVPGLVRVNLRPFVADGGDAAALADDFVATANDPRGSADLMDQVLGLAVRWLSCAGRGELAPDLEALATKMAEEGYPAIHHSEIYREAYRPAYRVVSAERASAQGWCGESFERSNVAR